MNDTARHGARSERMGWLVTALLALAATALITALTAGDAGTALPAFVLELVLAAPLAGLWLIAAAGFGGPIARRLLREHDDRALLAVPLGVAALVVIDNVLGRIGLLAVPAVAWGVLVIGMALAVVSVARGHRPRGIGWRLLPAAIPIAVLVVAATVAPGWLWASEFGGYDALSYHLQLPREWIAHGRLAGFEHNVYGFLPSYAESAFMHLAVLRGDAIAAAPAAQLLHAMLTITTALVTARLATRHGGARAGAVAAAIVLGTPWVIVVGSLAYDEMFVTLMLAGGLLALDAPARSWRTAVVVGLLAGAATGAKLTAAGFALAPLLALLVVTGDARPAQRVRLGLVASVIVAAALLPWLIGNLVDAGSPTFPFLTRLFGAAHWTADQTQRWGIGHAADLGWLARIGAGWRELFVYGFGAGRPGEPWWPQWSILPWLATLGLLVAGATPATRSRAGRYGVVLAVQILFWLAATHIKSRFILPAVVPAALLVPLAVTALATRQPSATARVWTAMLITAGVYALAPLLLFAREQNGAASAAIGAIPLFRGDAHAAALADAHDPNERGALRDTAPPAYWIAHTLDSDARVLLIGDATPFYLPSDRIEYVTVWDRGPVSAALDTAGDTPHAWITELRERGYTHVLIDPVMLDRWTEAGWGDPRMTTANMFAGAEARGTVVQRFGGGKALYRIDE